MKTKTAAVLLATALLAAGVSTGFGGIGLQWSLGGWMVEYGADVTVGPGIAENNDVYWQLIYAGENGVADYPDLENPSSGWVSGDDMVLAQREIPCGGGMAADGTEWNEWLELMNSISPVYEDLSWTTSGYVFQRIYQGTPSPYWNSYYFESELFQLDTSYLLGQVPQVFSADPKGEGLYVDRIIEPIEPYIPYIPPQTETQTTPVPVPYAWLDANASAILATFGYDYEAAANAVAANGRPVWECYVAGLSTTDAAADFKVSISIVKGQPVVAWTPDLNEGGTSAARIYTVEGKPTISNAWWTANASNRFFRVRVSTPEGGGEVLSSNAVGYVKRFISAGWMQILSIPFVNPASDDGLFRFGETQIAKELPTGSVVYFWDEDNQMWNGGMKSAFGWNPAEANHVLQVGEGFGVKTSEDIEVTIAGEVPSEPCLRRSYAGDNAWSVMAYPYPVDIKFIDTSLASEVPVRSEVWFWEPDAERWVTIQKNARIGWPGSANYALECGAAFFIRSVTAGTWEAVKPYAWP